ncbi:helix-turn-helix domain-containing protein [Chryseobacterium sp. SORGH_AS_0447]|uniref:helix-turn-helix domain-containing protein n=1 Tax=Chryseobacterium sp. SORGH_AS_0447 TaxID=3041769 RepID=UPI0027D92786|nr:helix-turn-helix domain-containing protein [Chryseobacterium sp. SORGH_AS_0447]
MKTPDYRKIYQDMIRMKYPEKEELCQSILSKKRIEPLDIIRLNAVIAGNSYKERARDNQKLKSYDKKTILQILHYQKKNQLNNTELAKHFDLSRNTVAKWRKIFFSLEPPLDEPC